MTIRLAVVALAALLAAPLAAPATGGRQPDHHQRHRHHRRRQPADPQSRRRGDQRRQHRGGRYAGGDCRALQGGRDDRRHRQGGDARPDQHPHPCGDGDVPRPGERSQPDGLAAEVHLPGRGEDGVSRVRSGRHAPGAAGDDRVGHHHLRRHVLLRGGSRARDQGGRDARRARADRDRVSGARREDARRCAGAHGSVREGVRSRRIDHAVDRAALGLHARRQDAHRRQCARAEV